MGSKFSGTFTFVGQIVAGGWKVRLGQWKLHQRQDFGRAGSWKVQDLHWASDQAVDELIGMDWAVETVRWSNHLGKWDVLEKGWDPIIVKEAIEAESTGALGEASEPAPIQWTADQLPGLGGGALEPASWKAETSCDVDQATWKKDLTHWDVLETKWQDIESPWHNSGSMWKANNGRWDRIRDLHWVVETGSQLADDHRWSRHIGQWKLQNGPRLLKGGFDNMSWTPPRMLWVDSRRSRPKYYDGNL